MPFLWSDNAAHIQRLYRPWQPSNGYAEAEVRAAEQKLKHQFPATLRNFYRSWGARDDLTRTNQTLLRLDDLCVQDDALIICVENQCVWYWAIACTTLTENNPPICMARNEKLTLVWEPSHAHLSDFLDWLCYQHAFDGGAIHGAYSKESVTDDLLKHMRSYGQEHVLPTYPPWFVPSNTTRRWSLVLGEQYAVDGLAKVVVASQTSEVLDYIGNGLQITWDYRW